MEKAIQSLAEEQAKTGHEVHVITSTLTMRSKQKKEVINGVHIHRVGAIRLHFPDLTYPMGYPRYVLEETDIVHVHSQNSLFNIILAECAKKLGKPLVIDFLALDYLKSHPNPLIRLFGNHYQERAQRRAASLADKAITMNEKDHRILRKKYGIESEIIPHGIDERYLTKPKDEKLFREKYGVNKENVIAYIGRIHPSKGLDVLVKALPLIAHEVNDSVAVIAGGGSEAYRRSLLMLARKLKVDGRVRILGYISEDEKISLLDASKVFVLPSRHFGEAYPLVVDEAYARGVPIIASRVGILPLRIRHLKTGMIVRPNDPSLLANAVMILLKDDELSKAIHAKIKDEKTKLLTWQLVCERIKKGYQEIITKEMK
ncbi:glycosyltransferase family 4 protein [Candidatus Bathyarchaeota archaeon]|nr:glycosyltransferase family 4 protein [Candidatus Bathyarchaeota archaeon]